MTMDVHWEVNWLEEIYEQFIQVSRGNREVEIFLLEIEFLFMSMIIVMN